MFPVRVCNVSSESKLVLEANRASVSLQTSCCVFKISVSGVMEVPER